MTATIAQIKQETAARFGLVPALFDRQPTIETVVVARRIAVHLSMCWTGARVPDIARSFGMPDSWEPVEIALDMFAQLGTNPRLRAAMAAIEERLELTGAIPCRHCPGPGPDGCPRCGATPRRPA